MIHKVTITVLLAAALAASGCDTGTPEVEPVVVVVRAYLFAGEPVDDIQLTSTQPLSSQEQEGAPITDASVYLFKNDSLVYHLTPQPGRAGYYHYPGDDLAVEVGDFFFLIVEYQGREITAATYIPDEPRAVELSPTRLLIEASKDEPVLTIKWEDPEGKLHWVTIRNTEADPAPIHRECPEVDSSLPIQSPILDAKFVEFGACTFTHFGRHEVRVYRISADYFDLYQFTSHPVRRIYEPHTNVENGFGIFSGFSSVTRSFTIEPESNLLHK